MKKFEISKQNIILAAIDQIAANGLHGTSIRSIAKQMNVEHSRLYYYFKSKDELIANVFLYIAVNLQNEINTLQMDGMSPEERFKTIIRTIYNYLSKNTNQAKVYRMSPLLYDMNETDKQIFLSESTQNCRFVKLLQELTDLNEVTKTLQLEIALICYLPIMDFATYNKDEHKIAPFINSLWNSISKH
ncbi:TetR/AcrR family transcriptional regulator [Seleniivibrio woodruffii]|uniref:TetR/AcrR family transcriptional regulator n=1 Tax=Seleniivibrio woodruffii TaxID=1078050 RepID=UPI00240A0876|nr:TetR/AcrR family transcriptional regulator [Seleniivibrio woodruffii]